MPDGVELEPFYEDVPDVSSFEEAVTQIQSSIDHTGYLLRGNHSTKLKVHLSQLKSDAKIIMSIEEDTLLEDMSLWLIDMAAGAGENDKKWGKLVKALSDVSEKKEFMDSLTSCFVSSAKTLQTKYSDANKRKSSDAKKHLSEDIKKAIEDCAEPTGKAVTSLWGRIWNKTKEVAETIEEKNPVTQMIERFKVLWDNPGMIDEWIDGMFGTFLPDDTIGLKINPNPLEKVDWTKIITGTNLGCNGSTGPNRGIEIDEKQFQDVTGDGKAEAFIAVSCISSTSSWPSRLYVFDGGSDPANPRFKILLDYKDGTDERGLRIGSSYGYNPDASITFHGSTVSVVSAGYSPTDPNASLSNQITDIFTWTGNGFVRGKRIIIQPSNIKSVPQVITNIQTSAQKVKSFKYSAVDSLGDKFNWVFVSPDRFSGNIISNNTSLIAYSCVLIGDEAYLSSNGMYKKWDRQDAQTTKALQAFAYPLKDLFTLSDALVSKAIFNPLPDEVFEGKDTGVIQIFDKSNISNQNSIGVIYYDKQTYLITQVTGYGTSSATANGIQKNKLISRFYDFNSPSNNVEKPSK